MERLLTSIVVVAVLAGCATPDPTRRYQVASEESARLAAPTTPLSSYGKFELKPMEMGPEVAGNAAKAAGAWTFGATDRNLMDYIADIATQYLQNNRK